MSISPTCSSIGRYKNWVRMVLRAAKLPRVGQQSPCTRQFEEEPGCHVRGKNRLSYFIEKPHGVQTLRYFGRLRAVLSLEFSCQPTPSHSMFSSMSSSAWLKFVKDPHDSKLRFSMQLTIADRSLAPPICMRHYRLANMFYRLNLFACLG